CRCAGSKAGFASPRFGMTRFASAPWPLRAAYVGTLAAGAVTALAVFTLTVALAGLGQLSGDIDPAAVPAWFWYFRGDPDVRRWLAVGVLSSVSVSAFVAVGVARSLRPPLHGAARWASEAELVRAGLRAECGIVLGRK